MNGKRFLLLIPVVALAALLTAMPAVAQGPADPPTVFDQVRNRVMQHVPTTAWERMRAWFRFGTEEDTAEANGLTLRAGCPWNGEGTQPPCAGPYGAPQRQRLGDATAEMSGAAPNAQGQFVDENGDGVCDLCGKTCDGDCDGTPDRLRERDQDGSGFGRPSDPAQGSTTRGQGGPARGRR